MLFNSFTFWLFYAIVLLLYWRMRHRGQNILLLIGSYFFYGCWDYRFLSLIAFSTLVDYYVARKISDSDRPSTRRYWLFSSMVTNLGILAFFKYYGFFAGELVALSEAVGVPLLLPTLQIVLPVGISFYTFQTMSYTIDVYRRDCEPARNLLDFAVYVSFFPQLVAGPIERAAHFLPQVLKERHYRAGDFEQGMSLIVLGLFKKIVIADNMAVLVNSIFSTPTSELSGLEVLVGVYAFAFQIYGDFSGYSSIARGISKWLGFDLMVNFQRPYFAIDPSDFWRRWHISLSQWLRDYLYIPLGGNRRGSVMTYRNLMLTMVLGGLWHGANWTFIVWGFIHGLLLCGYRLLAPRFAGQNSNDSMSRLNGQRMVQMVVMFHLICLTWLLFRAENISQANTMLWLVFTDWAWTPTVWLVLGMLVFCAGPLLVYEAFEEFGTPEWKTLLDRWSWQGMAYAYAMLMCICFPPPAASSFIYFQF
ncbi:MAG: MBOAT family protein [Planctomycetaceae bacterium]|nr:MBOAT family protein [Planctomycetaceae bacterium]